MQSPTVVHSQSGWSSANSRAQFTALCVGILCAWSSTGNVAQDAPRREYQAYALRHKSVQEAERLISVTLPELGETVHVVADTAANQILVGGSERAQQLARQLLESIDQPSPVSAPPAVSAEPPVLRVYPVVNAQAMQLQLRNLFPDEHAVRIAAETKGGQLVVHAAPAVQQQIAAWLAQNSRAGSPAPTRLSSTPSASAFAGAVGDLTVRLVHSRVSDAETQLLKTLGARLEPLPAAAPQTLRGYRLQVAPGNSAELLLDDRGNTVLVRGRLELARQLARLIQALDSPATTRDGTTRIVPFRTADPQKVKQALDAYRGQGALVPAGGPSDNSSSSRQRSPAASRSIAGRTMPRPTTTSGIALVAYIFEDAAGAPGQAAPGPLAPQPGGEETQRQQQLRELGMDVDVETLPDLDVVILRGRDRDVEELAKIIEELERLSAEAEPDIEVYALRHVRGSALAQIIQQISRDLIGGRQGRVAVISLEKPNALLLIGWGEALTTIRELIRKLDQPVSPETQLQVFALQHADPDELAQLLSDFFDNREGLGPQVTIVADPRSESLIVQAAPRDLEEVQLLIRQLDQPLDKVNQAKIFKLKHALAADIAQTLEAAINSVRQGRQGDRSAILEFLSVDGEQERLIRSGLLTTVEFTPNPRNNTLLVTAPAESMELLAALITQLDTDVAVAQIKVFRVINGDANNLVITLRSLFPAETGVSQGPALAGAEGETSLVPLRFSVDTRSNSIIVTGSEGDLKIIEALLLRLDERGLNDRKNQVYRLKNAPALEVANAINEFLRSERIVQQAAPGVESPFEQIEREVVVVPETISNSLILSSTPRFFEEIEQLINKLDEEPPQVMIQVLIAEVKLDNLDEFGIEMGLQDSVLFDRSLLGDLLTTTSTNQLSTPAGILTSTQETIEAATNTPGYVFNTTPVPQLPNSGSERSLATSSTVAPQGITNFSLGRFNNELGFGGLVLSASSESVSLLLRALQDSRRVEILSRPQVRTLDNQPAFIQIGERVPRVIQSTITTGGTITNSIDLENVGLILGVTPRISPEGMVVMEVDAEKSELGSEAEGVPISISMSGTIIRAPIVRTTMAQATVSAVDGETIVLGGLISKTTSTISRRVPYLADIPILGQLFRYDSAQGEKKELLIILTPHLIRTPEDSERIKQLETARISWCSADVHAIHGVAGLCDITDCPACAAQIPALYPDFDPRGIRPNAGPAPVDPDSLRFEEVPTNPAGPALRSPEPNGSGVMPDPPPPPEPRFVEPPGPVNPAGPPVPPNNLVPPQQ
jgi:type II secretion system protein D